MLKIAITGNIASGKSQVEKILIKLEYPVYDTDIIAHELLDNIKDFYDYDVFTDGKIDRKKLGNLVFSDIEIKQKLEALTHPKIKLKILELFEKHNNDKFVFISVPLLYEAGFESIFDKVILVYTNQENQLKRLMARNNFSEEEALKRINSQTSYEEKFEKADFIIDNNSNFENLELQIINLVQNLL